DIGDARLDLEDNLVATVPAGSTPSRPWRYGKLPWSLTAIALFLAAVALGRLVTAHASVEHPAPMRIRSVTNFSGVETQPSLSPDGRSIAFISNRDGQWDIYVGLVSGGQPIRITNDSNLETRPRWSPDGTRLLFARLNDTGTSDIWVVPALGGTARRII